MSIDKMARTYGTDGHAAPIIGWYGDDFTGATDTLAELAHADLRALLFMGVPSTDHLTLAGPLDAVGIAGAARALNPEAMRAELEPVGRFFTDLRVPVLHYKVCSTFDSAPHVGNINVAVKTLRPYVDNAFVPIVCGQPNLGRYCVFSNLYAAAGTGGEVHRLDRHPTMSRHPVTPLHEADLRLHLAQQGLTAVGAIHYPAYGESQEAQDGRLNILLEQLGQINRETQTVLFDVADASHLAHVGRLIWQRALAQRLLSVGPSSVVQALVAHLKTSRNAAGFSPPSLALAKGPVFVLAGSLSPVTARQIEAATAYKRLPANAQRLLTDTGYRGQLLEEVITLLCAGHNTLVYTAPTNNIPVDTTKTQDVARVSADFVAQVVGRMAKIAPLRRIGIAGGDTSSQVTKALRLWGLSYQTNVATGVTLCRTHSDEPALNDVELMLKGGQIGSDDLFWRFANGF